MTVRKFAVCWLNQDGILLLHAAGGLNSETNFLKNGLALRLVFEQLASYARIQL